MKTIFVQAQKGKNIILEFKGEFGVFDKAGICYHWIEVQYNEDIGFPGPRFHNIIDNILICIYIIFININKVLLCHCKYNLYLESKY